MNGRAEQRAPDELGRAVVEELAETLRRVAQELDWPSAQRVAGTLADARKVFLFGAGRSRAIALALGQRLTHVGCDAVLIGEAGNSRFTERDALVVISGSGGSPSAVTIAELGAEPGGGTVIALTSQPDSAVARLADHAIVVPARSKLREQASLAPYTAPFDIAALAVGEALAKLLMDARGLCDEDIDDNRPNVE
jgi:6-phospho-3-hexuloisomerase